MIRTIKQISGRTLAARDGHIGTVKDLFFDDASWQVRYFVVDARSDWDRRTVIVSPEVVHPVDWTGDNLPVDLTMDQVRNSPGVQTDEPVSRRQEEELRRYYGWPMYWGGMFGAADVVAPIPPPVPDDTARQQPPPNPNLRSAEATLGYHLEATDGAIGHVQEFLVDERTWQIRYLVIDTRNWLPGRKVVIAPAWIESTDWAQRRLLVNLTRDAIKHSPPYEPDLQWNPAYSAELHEHYQRPPYADWETEVVADAPGVAQQNDRFRDSRALFPRRLRRRGARTNVLS
jgi:hypothetical protein